MSVGRKNQLIFRANGVRCWDQRPCIFSLWCISDFGPNKGNEGGSRTLSCSHHRGGHEEQSSCLWWATCGHKALRGHRDPLCPAPTQKVAIVLALCPKKLSPQKTALEALSFYLDSSRAGLSVWGSPAPTVPAGAHLGVHIMFSSNLMPLLFRCQAGHWLLLVLPAITPHLDQPWSLGSLLPFWCLLRGPPRCQGWALSVRSFHVWPWVTSFSFRHAN